MRGNGVNCAGRLRPASIAGGRGLSAVLLAVAVLAAPVIAGSHPDHRVLDLRVGKINTLEAENLLAALPDAFDGGSRYVLQLDGPMTPARRAALIGVRVGLGPYLPVDAFVTALDDVDPAALAGLDFVVWVSPLKREWKIDPDLGNRTLETEPRRALKEAGLCQAVIVLFPGEDPEGLLEAVGQIDGTILSTNRVGGRWLVDAVFRPADAAVLADRREVQYVEDAPEGQVRNDTNAWIVQSKVIDQMPIWDHGLHGEGQIAGIIDATVRESHCAFEDKTEEIGPAHRKIVAMRNPGDESLHGTHIAGTLVGDYGTYGAADLYDGVAFAARMSFSGLEDVSNNPSTLYARLMDAHNDGARVHNNSWGDDATTEYTSWCQQIDQLSYDREGSLVVFAVTNTATLKTPENAKNVLAVGASHDFPEHEYHCSGGTGPTSDGRRKPEVFAPGCGTLSADPELECAFIGLTGTSAACPVIAGAGLLVRQYFTEGFYPSGSANAGDARVPSGALIKAVLINAAEDMSGIAGYPSASEGWGQTVLDNSLYFAGDARKLWVQDVLNTNGLNTGQIHEYQFRVFGNAELLRVTLAYTEPPATVGAADPVVNNLDLKVFSPDGKLFRGNRFMDGYSVPNGQADNRNNVEQVHLPVPFAGVYTVVVRGAAVNEGTQGYALVATGQVTDDLGSPDCNTNGVPDEMDISAATSDDCQPNGLPDECEPLEDCNTNGTLDECETQVDCNSNCIPDECESERDCNDTGTPDDCEGVPDCNQNGWPDTCDILHGSSEDCQPNGVPDDCEVFPETTVYEVSEGAAVPDFPGGPIVRYYDVLDHRTTLDLDVDLDIEHTYNGDVVVTLSHGPVTATLIERPGHPTQNAEYGYADTGFDVMLDDDAFTSIESYTNGWNGVEWLEVVGTFQPYPDRLADFNGLDAFGTWVITVQDMSLYDTGTLVAWSLRITEPPGPVPGCYDPGDCDGNGYVDLDDFPQFVACMRGPTLPLLQDCGCADLNDDGRVDLADFAEFQHVFDPPAKAMCRPF